VKRLRELGFAVEGYFYNPNIHPYKEFERRFKTAREFAEKVNLSITIDDDYKLKEWLTSALNAPNGRCMESYESRLSQAARFAKENGFDTFTSSLLVSPYQQHDVIRSVGERYAAEYGIKFFYDDFRLGWDEGVQISLDLELYRQPYCGCIFSEQERYDKKLRKRQKAERKKRLREAAENAQNIGGERQEK
jgi:hypothetical protein